MNKQQKLYREDIERVMQTKGVESLKGKTILVTGATGMVGVMLIDTLMAMGEVRVVAVGRSKAKAEERLGEYYASPWFEFVEHDMLVGEMPDVKADVIVPLASNTHPLAYSQMPMETMLINLRGAEQALTLARRHGAVVLYPSTVEVYGNAREGDVLTEDYTGVLNLATSRACYTESKRAAEAMCQSAAAEHGVKVRIVRLSRLFGPTMLMSDSKASSQFVKKALAGEDIVLKSTGEQYFSYTYVADAVSAMLHVLLHGEDGVAYNICNPACDCHLRDFAAICAETCGREVVFDLPSETERKGFSIATQAILSNERLRSIGWEGRYGIREAIERTVEQMRENEK